MDMQALQSLITFFNFIQNPDSYKDTVTDLKKTVSDYEKYIKTYTTVKEANDYLTKAKLSLAENEANKLETTKALRELSDSQNARYVQDMQQLESKRADLARWSSELEVKENSLLAREVSLNSLSSSLDQKKVDLYSLEQDVARQTTELQTKQEKLKQLLGA